MLTEKFFFFCKETSIYYLSLPCESHALKDDVLTALDLEDSVTDRSTVSVTPRTAVTALYPKVSKHLRVIGGRDWSTSLLSLKKALTISLKSVKVTFILPPPFSAQKLWAT